MDGSSAQGDLTCSMDRFGTICGPALLWFYVQNAPICGFQSVQTLSRKNLQMGILYAQSEARASDILSCCCVDYMEMDLSHIG